MSTRTETREEYAPSSLRDVWARKDAVYQETKDLSLAEALGHIIERGRAIREELGLPVACFPVLPGASASAELRASADSELKVAEEDGGYSAKRG